MVTFANEPTNPYGDKVTAPMRDGSIEARIAVLRSAIDEAYNEFDNLVGHLDGVTNPMPTSIDSKGAPGPSIPGSAYGIALQVQINRVGELCDKIRHLRNALDLT